MSTIGKVFLVGAGPGDPELLTIKAHRLLREADVVVYDRLVSQAVLGLIPPGTSRIYVGKATRCHSMVQDEINALLVKLSLSGSKVIRLKGGDPFVFGRGSEEAEVVSRHGIPFEVVPGVTAASGCTSALGIPLTHRGVANGVRYVTGHSREYKDLDLNWPSLADPDTTLVVYMGLSNLPAICSRLVAEGLPQDTPAVAIANGTTPQQKICRASLSELPEAVANAGLTAPVLVVIGKVVGLAESWNGAACAADVIDLMTAREERTHA